MLLLGLGRQSRQSAFAGNRVELFGHNVLRKLALLVARRLMIQVAP